MEGDKSGDLEKGLGSTTWWGFSPWYDFPQGDALVIGAGDPRQLIKLAHQANNAENTLNVYIMESKVDVYAKQILLMSLILDEDLEVSEKVEMYLDLFANLNITERTASWMRVASNDLGKKIGRREPLDFFNLSKLKERDLDLLGFVFLKWSCERIAEKKMKQYWDFRINKLLGERMEAQEGIADGHYLLRFVERGGASIQRQQFIQWRKTGQAFSLPYEEDELEGNLTLLNEPGNHRAYWGDIITGPFVSHGLDHNTTWKVQDNEVEDASNSSFTDEVKKRLEEVFSHISTDSKIVIYLLSPSANMLKLNLEVATIWLGVSMTHYLEELKFKAPKLVVETPLYLLQLENNLLESFKTKVLQMVENSGYKPNDFDVMTSVTAEFSCADI